MVPTNVPENQYLKEQYINTSTQTSSPHISFIYIKAFIGVVLFLFLIIFLNFFNILSLSTLLPNQFGWLPHKEKVVSGNSKPDEKSPQNPSTPTVTGYIKFSYDTIKAEKILKDYITENIKDTYIPSKIDVKQHLLATGELKGTDYQFGSNWISNGAIFNAVFHYLTHTNNPRDMEFYIIPPDAQNTPVDSSNSEKLIRNYLKNIPDSISFDCGEFEKTTVFCEYFSISSAGKNGLGIIASKDEQDSNVLLIFSCFIPKNDSFYNKRSSCMLFRERDSHSL